MKNYSHKQIMLITLPVMLSVLMEQLINITDAIFLGRVGEVEVGAAGLAGIYYLSLYILGFGFCIGLQVLIARRNGEGRHCCIVYDYGSLRHFHCSSCGIHCNRAPVCDIATDNVFCLYEALGHKRLAKEFIIIKEIF